MKEKIYTIPVNEGFEADDECPFCAMVYDFMKLDLPGSIFRTGFSNLQAVKIMIQWH